MTTPSRQLRRDLVRALAATPTLNDHSHVIPEAERLQTELDALVYFAHPYPAADLQSAGMSADELKHVADPAAPLEERWRRFEPYWRRVRLTGFSQCLLEGWRATFGIDGLSAETVGPLSDAIRAARRPGHYREVLRDRATISVSLVQMEDLVDVDRELFLPMPRLNRWSMLRSRESVEALERDYRVSLRSLDDLLGAIQQTCVLWHKAGAPAVKLSQSYHRPMDFKERAPADAARVYRTLLDGGYAGLDSADGRVLEDYLVFACVRAATAAGLPVQFHVGPRAGTYGSLEGAPLAPMIDLVRANRDARFDISHAGFPYLREAAVLAKTCANVFLNMSWIHIYSPDACVTALREWLRMVPWNKVLGFGDDLYWVDTIYGHLIVARENVAAALASLIEEGFVSESEALDVGRGLFYDNAAALYGLGG
ncbi:MAG TPA: amidohydrolase family protein [Chloroflexota bacterium]|nr:amidohydrolase family protein [Chloroflexota bacterium]